MPKRASPDDYLEGHAVDVEDVKLTGAEMKQSTLATTVELERPKSDRQLFELAKRINNLPDIVSLIDSKEKIRPPRIQPDWPTPPTTVGCLSLAWLGNIAAQEHRLIIELISDHLYLYTLFLNSDQEDIQDHTLVLLHNLIDYMTPEMKFNIVKLRGFENLIGLMRNRHQDKRQMAADASKKLYINYESLQLKFIQCGGVYALLNLLQMDSDNTTWILNSIVHIQDLILDENNQIIQPHVEILKDDNVLRQLENVYYVIGNSMEWPEELTLAYESLVNLLKGTPGECGSLQRVRVPL